MLLFFYYLFWFHLFSFLFLKTIQVLEYMPYVFVLNGYSCCGHHGCVFCSPVQTSLTSSGKGRTLAGVSDQDQDPVTLLTFLRFLAYAGYMEKHMGIPPAEIPALCNYCYTTFGTTMAGLVVRLFSPPPPNPLLVFYAKLATPGYNRIIYFMRRVWMISRFYAAFRSPSRWSCHLSCQVQLIVACSCGVRALA